MQNIVLLISSLLRCLSIIVLSIRPRSPFQFPFVSVAPLYVILIAPSCFLCSESFYVIV